MQMSQKKWVAQGWSEQEQGMEPVPGQPGRTSTQRWQSPVSRGVVADPLGLMQMGEVAGFVPNPPMTMVKDKGTCRTGV